VEDWIWVNTGILVNFSSVTKIPDINNFREEGFIWAHGSQGFGPGLLGPMCLGKAS
jgi:hypothetical protein